MGSKKKNHDVTSQAPSDDEAEVTSRKDGVSVAPDGGWGWMVLLASFTSSVVVDGVCFSFGIFYLQFLEDFGENRGRTAWIGSVLNGMYMITAPLAGALSNRYGCRPVAMVGSVWATTAFILSTFSNNVNTLIFTYGVLGGMGFGLMYLPSIVIVGFYFDKKRALATGIATCGSGIGAFIFAPISKALIDHYGWRGAQWVLSGIVLNGVVCGSLYRPLPVAEEKVTSSNDVHQTCDQSEGNRVEVFELDMTSLGSINLSKMAHLGDSCHSLNSKAAVASATATTANGYVATAGKESGCLGVLKDLGKNISSTMDVSMLKDPVFDIYAVSCILCMAGFFVPFIYLPAHAIGQGNSAESAAWLLAILGITNTVGRIISGFVSDRPWADCLLINNCALIVGGIATILCPFCYSYTLLAVYTCVFGLAVAAFVSLRSIILVDLIGLNKLTSAFGIIVLCQGITSFVGAPFAGWLFDISGTYDLSFYVAGTSIALAGVICLPLRRLARWRQRHQEASYVLTVQ